jgi:hypothetical protein
VGEEGLENVKYVTGKMLTSNDIRGKKFAVTAWVKDPVWVS